MCCEVHIPQLNGSHVFSSRSCESAGPFWFRWLSWSFSYTSHQLEGQLVTGWPQMVEQPRVSASRTASFRGLFSPGPDHCVSESITRCSPRAIAWGLTPLQSAHGKDSKAGPPPLGDTGHPDDRWAGHVLVVSATIAVAKSFPVAVSGSLPTDHVQNSAEEAHSGALTQAGGLSQPCV